MFFFLRALRVLRGDIRSSFDCGSAALGLSGEISDFFKTWVSSPAFDRSIIPPALGLVLQTF
jgi:hypothetical protein